VAQRVLVPTFQRETKSSLGGGHQHFNLPTVFMAGGVAKLNIIWHLEENTCMKEKCYKLML